MRCSSIEGVFVIKTNSVLKISISGLLIAVGIIIPVFSPIRIVLEPASFTLASHVAIFIAMFISPGIAVAVAVGTTIGFFIGGFPLVVVLRAASHIVFSIIGSIYLLKFPLNMHSAIKLRVFSFLVALIHAFCEVIVVSIFYFSGYASVAYYQNGFLMTVVLLVGFGTVIHSMIDFEIANGIMVALKHSKIIQSRQGL